MDNRILWTRCSVCGAQLYLKRLSGKRPTHCDTCRKARQDEWKKKKEKMKDGNSN